MVEFSSSSLIPEALLAKAEDVIERYGLIGAGEPVLVALSGGKDSLFLCLALRELGLSYRPLVIDMGYESGWGTRVVEAAGSLRLDPEVVSVRDGDRSVTPASRTFLARNLEVLDAAESGGTFTPCTYCYNAKAIALESFAERNGVRKVAFGHHQTDAYASLIKEALMHVDRWDREHASYSRDNFVGLVSELKAEARSFAAGESVPSPAETPLMTRMSTLVAESKVDTDEPPRQPLRDGSEIEIVRPLFDIGEHEIGALRDALELPTEPSGCGHGATIDTETPREIVQRAILREERSEALELRLHEILLESIAEDGRGRARARHRRDVLLGPDYKPVADDLQKL